MLKHFTYLTAVAGLLLCGPLTTTAQQLNVAKLDSLVNSLAANNQLMGSLALSHEGKVVYSRAFGAAQVAPAVPATPDTRYRIGSISKMFTAVMTFQLIEEKKLTLDTPLAKFFPQLPNAATITIDQLLSHRSGLRNFTNDADYQTYMTQPQSRAEMLARLSKAAPDFAPGTKAEYSNTNYVLLGYIVEQLSKMPYAQAVQKRVTDRAKLPNTYYGGKIGARQPEAFSYQWTGTTWQLKTETDPSVPGGAGSMVSTSTDLTHFLEALFGGKLVSATHLAAMQEVRDEYGRGLFAMPFAGHKGYGHEGAIDGFLSTAAYFPAEQLAVALCSNGGPYSTNELLVGALSSYFGRPYRLPDFRASTFVPAPADLDRYAGTYSSPKLPIKISFTRQGNTLLSQATGQSAFPLEPVSIGVFRFTRAGIRVEFDAKEPKFTLQQGGGVFEFVKE